MDGLSQLDRINKFKSVKYPSVLRNDTKSLLRKAMLIASFIRYHSLDIHENSDVATYFDKLFIDPIDGKSLKDKYPLNLIEGEVEPSWTVLINFIENLNQTSEQFNQRWNDLINWYIDQVLGLKSLPVIGDKVWVSIENKKSDTTFLEKDTRFKVKRENNTTYYYQITEDTEINNIEIDKFYVVNVDRRVKVFNNKDSETNSTYSYTRNIKVNELILDGSTVLNSVKTPPLFGLEISSPLLYLKEGKRTVDIIFYSRNDDWFNIIKDSKNTFNNAFYIEISTEKGWQKIEDYRIIRQEKNLLITFYLADSYPSVIACDKELHNQETEYPVLKLYLNFNSEDYENAALELLHLSHIKLNADVHGLSNLQIYNELGKIDNSKPFMPFGINANKGSWFTVGSYEMNIKDTQMVDLKFEWEELTEDSISLKEHYIDYKKGIKNNSFEVKVRYLSDFYWKDVLGRSVYPLFASKQDYDSISNYSSINNINVEKMPQLSIEESQYEYSLQAREGFLNITLINPEIGFGENEYRKIFSEQLMRNARKKNKFPTIKPPIQPILRRLTLNYTAQDIIDFNSNSELNKSFVRSILPFNLLKLTSDITNEFSNFLPDLHFRNLFMALKNVKENSLLNLYFEFIPFENKDIISNSIYEQRDKIRNVKIFIGNPYNWERAPVNFLRKDETYGLIVNGCVQFQFPENIPANLFDSEGRIWIRIGFENVENVRFPEISAIYSNTAELEMVLPETGLELLKLNLKDGEVQEDTVIAGIGEIKRITPFFGGRGLEDSLNKLIRLSEYTSHKGRAVAPKDYENLILQAFPEIAKVKYLPKSQLKVLNENVYLVVLPKDQFSTKGLYPLTPPHLIFEIEKYIRNLCSPYIKKVSILNPVYEEVIIRGKIKLSGYFSVVKRKLLAKRINEMIAPWLYSNESPTFDIKLKLNEMHDKLIAEFGELIHFTDFSAILIEKGNDEYILEDFIYKKNEKVYDCREIKSTESHGILVPSSEHIFYWENDEIPEDFGIEEMGVNKNLIVSKRKTC